MYQLAGFPTVTNIAAPQNINALGVVWAGINFDQSTLQINGIDLRVAGGTFANGVFTASTESKDIVLTPVQTAAIVDANPELFAQLKALIDAEIAVVYGVTGGVVV